MSKCMCCVYVLWSIVSTDENTIAIIQSNWFQSVSSLMCICTVFTSLLNQTTKMDSIALVARPLPFPLACSSCVYPHSVHVDIIYIQTVRVGGIFDFSIVHPVSTGWLVTTSRDIARQWKKATVKFSHSTAQFNLVRFEFLYVYVFSMVAS